MSWKLKDVSEMGISDGLVLTLKDRFKVATCGDLAAGIANGKLPTLKAMGSGVCAVIFRELATISGGEFKEPSETSQPATVGLDTRPEVAEHRAPGKTGPDVSVAPAGVNQNVNPNDTKPEATSKPPEMINLDTGAPTTVTTVTKTDKKPLSVSKLIEQMKLKVGSILEVVSIDGDDLLSFRAVEPKATAQLPSDDMSRLLSRDEAANKILKQQEKVRELKHDYDKKKDSSLAAKKTYDEQNSILLDMLDELVDPQLRLPTMGALAAEQPLPPQEKPPVAEAATAEPPAASIGNGGDPNWQDESVTVLMGDGIGRGTLNKLDAAGIKTMGALNQAFRENGIYAIEGLGKAAADKIRAKAFAWLGEHQPKQPEGEMIRLLKDIEENGQVIVESGAHVPVSRFGDGGMGFEHSGVTRRLEPGEWEAIVRPKMIQIIRPVPTADNEQDGLLPGRECEVVRWQGNAAVVKSAAGRECLVAPSEFTALE